MDSPPRPISDSHAPIRRIAGIFLFTVLLVVAFGAPSGNLGGQSLEDRHSITYFRDQMRLGIRADHPAILPVAAAIRAVTTDPLQQLVMVNDITHLLVDYDDDARVYRTEDFHATLDEMIARRRLGGWSYLRDDCDGRAVFAAHLLASLGIPWRFEASYWKEHAWVTAQVGGVDYDLLDLRRGARETNRLGYKLFGRMFVRSSHPPPYFDWRGAWASRTHQNLQVGLTLGMLTLDSKAGSLHARHSTDWTRVDADNPFPPLDDARARFAGIAGFPYGERLTTGMLAVAQPSAAPAATANARGPALGGTTGASSTPTVEATLERASGSLKEGERLEAKG